MKMPFFLLQYLAARGRATKNDFTAAGPGGRRWHCMSYPISSSPSAFYFCFSAPFSFCLQIPGPPLKHHGPLTSPQGPSRGNQTMGAWPLGSLTDVNSTTRGLCLNSGIIMLDQQVFLLDLGMKYALAPPPS